MRLEIVQPEETVAFSPMKFRKDLHVTSLLNFEDYGVPGIQQLGVPIQVSYRPEQQSTAPIVGGLCGHTFASYLFISLLWVSEDNRTEGVGSGLILKAEEEARKRGSTMSLVDTFSFQAEPFYVKNGYTPYARLPGGFEGRSARIYLSKPLSRCLAYFCLA